MAADGVDESAEPAILPPMQPKAFASVPWTPSGITATGTSVAAAGVDPASSCRPVNSLLALTSCRIATIDTDRA